MFTDDDRERAVRELTRHCGEGRLTLDELEDRITEVYAATTEAELALAFRELPRFRPEPAEPVAAAEPAPAPRPASRRAWTPPAPRCGHRGMAKPPVLLIIVTALLFSTAHYLLAIALLVFVVAPRMQRTAVRA